MRATRRISVAGQKRSLLGIIMCELKSRSLFTEVPPQNVRHVSSTHRIPMARSRFATEPSAAAGHAGRRSPHRRRFRAKAERREAGTAYDA